VFLDLLDIREAAPDRYDLATYDELRAVIAAKFRERTQAEWASVFDGTDACVAPILPMSEAIEHPHIKGRGVFVEHEGLVQPSPAPRFSRTEATLALPPAAKPGAHTREALAAWGIKDIDALIDSGAAVQAD
jgi:alpha-methylacyl-CoA racemase